MNIKKWNEIFGYVLFIVGALKLLLLILVLMQLATSISAAFNGQSSNFDIYSTFSTTLGFVQLILVPCSIVMIILNIKKQPQVILGYLYGLGAILLEFLFPSSWAFYYTFVECSLYMKGGAKIRKETIGSFMSTINTKKMEEDTEWFYGNNDKK